MKTKITINGNKFLINGKPVYSEIKNANPASLGLLWNQRVIQGVFDDKKDRTRFNLFRDGVFDPDKNTDNLIKALPEWHSYGLRAITVGFQGGGPVNCVDVREIENNPFGVDGASLDPAYASRMDKLIRAADETGIIVICNFLYWAHANRIRDGRAITEAVKTASRFLRDGKYTNVIIDVANEYDIGMFSPHPIVNTHEGMAQLIKIAREFSGGMITGCSGGGCSFGREVLEESDAAIVHGNGSSRGEYYDFILKVKNIAGNKPILCNEDSPCHTRMDIGLETYTSWGYYNNFTKQIPPADYSVTPGEDLFFARRMARAVGIPVKDLPFENRFYLQGFEEFTSFHGKRVVRLAAEYPETVERVCFYQNGEKIYVSYDEPFFCQRETTWLAAPVTSTPGEKWKAEVFLTDGKKIEIEKEMP